ncbi:MULTISPECIES: hypothetical protein [unclassified Polaromonas]|uniref:hypothetical protein n=1 Tax=unclassified Polaromonas TaxID=2638319 RepID=UPI00129E518D|nr:MULTISPECIES: hypothetical protein [unclassified Polaromonas]QGJ20268.1 hypothetical protein F7R28_18960 [Polaromonas sp. Pch-P]
MKLFEDIKPGHGNGLDADQLFRKFRAKETVALLCGCLVICAAEVIHRIYFSQAFSIWKVRGAFIPLISILSISSMLMSSSLQKELNKKKFPNPVEQQVLCIRQLIDRDDPEAWRLFYLIARMARVFMFSFGLIATICVFSIFFSY